MTAPTPPKPPVDKPAPGRHRVDSKRPHDQLRMKDLLKRR